MESAKSEWAALLRHSSTPGHAIRGIEAHAEVGASGIGLFRYVLDAEMSRLRSPQSTYAECTATMQRADGLWKHTCFEAFIQPQGTSGYFELNFAPSRQWAIYRFNAYREGMSSPEIGVPPEISVRRCADRLELDAAVHLHELIGLQGSAHLKVGLSAVVEEEDGTISYWALQHPPGKPDFHRTQDFVLEL